MISFLKKYIPNWIKVTFHYLSDIDSKPYSLVSQIMPPKNISDFFIWGSEFENINFIAENIYSLLSGEKELVNHHFIFFSPFGNYLKEYTYSSDDYISRIKLPFVSDQFKYLSFFHYVTNDKSLNEILLKRSFNAKNSVIPQSRGYTQFFTKNSLIGCCVHGNFGGISSDLKTTAKQRNLHIYTPSYKFQYQFNYHLVFNNPTNKKLYIKIILSKSDDFIELSIDSMGTDFIEISKYDGSISFESRLPICRPLIFQNPFPSISNFDVMHS